MRYKKFKSDANYVYYQEFESNNDNNCLVFKPTSFILKAKSILSNRKICVQVGDVRHKCTYYQYTNDNHLLFISNSYIYVKVLNMLYIYDFNFNLLEIIIDP